MKNLLFILFLLPCFLSVAQTQSFDDMSDVISYMDGKKFYNAENEMLISYQYLSNYNTYGIHVKNASGATFDFINVDVSTYGSFADLFGMSPETGSNFGFRLYKGKLIVGRGEPGEQTFYLK
ncbi:MAG: hypothetical protein EBR91_06665 [Flavobacteriia bacterium]|jgi:hypothetical protein|nr:hypothetical protein [Flavobacteriia bacterium]NBV91830.1 hypothetical protein [Flavobacteriia bacterium]NBY40171.1 hypothetical protein [Flavobacteriia bacterium]